MKSHNPRQPYKVRCSDPTGFIDLVFFNAREDYLLKTLPLGQTRAVSGRIDRFGGELNMVHPDHIVPEDELANIQIVEPVHPMTAGLPPKVLRKAIEAAPSGCPSSRNGSIPPYSSNGNGKDGPRLCAPPIIRRATASSRRCRRRACGSPMTSC